jgi:hypothetical protein
MTKRFALALCVTTLLGGIHSVRTEATPLLEQGKSGRDIVVKKRALVPSTRVRRSALLVRRASIRRASYRRSARSIVSRRGASMRSVSSRRVARSIVSRRSVSTRRISLVSRRSPIQAVSVAYVAPNPVVVAAPQIQLREIPEVVMTVPSMPPVATSLPDPLYDNVERVSPVASSSLYDPILAWGGLTSLLSGKEPLSQSCYKTELNTDDPILIDINDQVNLLTNVPQENGGEALLNYTNLFHTMSSENFEKELSQHQKSVSKVAELSVALQDYEKKNVAGNPNRLEQVKQVGQSLLNRAQCLVDLGARFEHLSRKRSEEAQLSSSQPYSSVLAAPQIEEEKVNLPRRTSTTPSVDELNESLNDLIRSRK